MKQVISFDGVTLREVRFEGTLICNFREPSFLRNDVVCCFKIPTFAELFAYKGKYYLHTFITSHRLSCYSDYDSARNCFNEFVSL